MKIMLSKITTSGTVVSKVMHLTSEGILDHYFTDSDEGTTIHIISCGLDTDEIEMMFERYEVLYAAHMVVYDGPGEEPYEDCDVLFEY